MSPTPRAVAVVPFAADPVDPDAVDLARWLWAQTAAELEVPGVIEPRLVIDEVEIAPGALGEAAAQLEAEVALGAELKLEEGAVALNAIVAGPHQTKADFSETVPLGAALGLPRLLARAVLLAIGEDSSAPPELVEPEAPGELVLRFVRAMRRLEEDPEDLVALAVEVDHPAPRKALLDAARAEKGGDRMPEFFSALDRLAEARPDDAEVLLALADYRALHFDEAGAREKYLEARECAEDPALAAEASAGAAALAERAGRTDEAILHLRAAVKLHDDAAWYARLGALLLSQNATEGLQMLTRATVLAPDDARLQLALARAIRESGGDPSRALFAATQAARLCGGEGELAEEVRAELELLLAAD